MKRRILLVDDDLAVLLTLKAVLELHGFEVETASSSAEAVVRMESNVYQMVISDLRMETEDAGLEVIRTAHRQPYDPATALLTAHPPSGDFWDGNASDAKKTDKETTTGKLMGGNPAEGKFREAREPEDWSGDHSHSLLIKPLGTSDLLRQVEALLIRQADKQSQRRNSAAEA
jgi:CheY-like chemotaxis protein